LTLALASFHCANSAALAGESAGTTPSDTAASTTQSRSSDAVHYHVVIDAPSELVDTLKNSVDLVRWQSYADMTEDLLDRLTRECRRSGARSGLDRRLFHACRRRRCRSEDGSDHRHASRQARNADAHHRRGH